MVSENTAELKRLRDNIGDLLGRVTGRVVREKYDDIAQMLGFEIVEQLHGDDLSHMVRENDPADITTADQQSCYRADLVAKVEDQHGNEFFLTMEASYTAYEGDTQRAVRNANLIGRFTGIDAVSAVASLENDDTVQQLVDDGAIRWFQFQPRDLRPL